MTPAVHLAEYSTTAVSLNAPLFVPEWQNSADVQRPRRQKTVPPAELWPAHVTFAARSLGLGAGLYRWPDSTAGLPHPEGSGARPKVTGQGSSGHHDGGIRNMDIRAFTGLCAT